MDELQKPENMATAITTPQAVAKNTKRIIFGITVLIAIAIVLLAFVYADQRNQETAVKAAQITMHKGGFTPSVVRVQEGQNVVWTNKDSSPHQITSSDLPELGTNEPLGQNETYSFTFTKKGTYTYYDANDKTAKRATVIVE